MTSDEFTQNQISIKRYRPLFGVLAVDETHSDDLVKVKAMLSGNTTYIENCIDENLLSVKLVLSRIQAYADEKELNTDINIVSSGFDHEKARANLLTSLSAIAKKEAVLVGSGKEMEKLLLRMFELGTQVGAINIQDLALRGRENIKKTKEANIDSVKKRQDKATARKQAYFHVFNQMKEGEYKLTYDGLLAFLKAQTDKKCVTGIVECNEVWLSEIAGSGLVLFDSKSKSGGAGRRTVDEFLKKYKNQ